MKTLKSILLVIVFLITVSKTHAQEKDFSKLAGPYLGQKPPGNIPELFAPGIISTEQFEFGGAFSPDGTEYFFTRRPDYEGAENRIYFMRIDKGKWTKPELAPFSHNSFEFLPIINPRGNQLIFYSERPKPDNVTGKGNLWITERSDIGWEKPNLFDSPANFEFCMMVSITKEGTIYFAGPMNGKRGIFRSKIINGKYSDPEFLPEEINYLKPNHPFISPDESFILMDAQPSDRGKPEIFISFKLNDGSWTKAVNMGETINATKREFAASISPDGKYLFFHRRIDGNGDIYWISAKIIEELRPKE